MEIKKRLSRGFFPAVFILSCFLPFISFAQSATVTPETQTIEKAKVISVSNQTTETIQGTGATEPVQTLTAQIVSGPDANQVVTFTNDYTQLAPGDIFYLRHTTSSLDGTDYYSVSDPYRLNVLLELAVALVVLIIVFGGLQGVRGFVSLCGSIVLIFYVLMPGILHGYSPVLVSIGVSSLIILLGSYITHGLNRTTTAAVLGMMVTVLITGAVAFWAVHAAHLSGYNSEEVVYLNFNTNGTIDLVGLLFGGIMIGLLGVLYDIAISQAIAVEELFRAGTHLTHIQVYHRAIRIGREHIGALVNTLAIAYVGAALPLLLVVQESSYGVAYAINNEIFATEIVRILIGSIGLILGVPITTLIASSMLSAKYAQSYESTGNHHHHSHH
ncbi:MAG TPA: YibE/F family protein [Candidatus Paceibacterota bacterium]|nr:YibE/F family protein [Candidatus Paceibacterota bacterium]